MADNIGKVTAMSSANEFQTKTGKSGLNFKAQTEDGEAIMCTIWGGSYGPTDGNINAGDVITAKMMQKGDYNGTRQFWINPTSVERNGSQAGSATDSAVGGSQQQPVAVGKANRVCFAEAMSIFTICMAHAKSVCDATYPEASTDALLEAAEKIALSFFIAWQQGKLPKPSIDESSADDMSDLISGIVDNMKSKGAM